MTDPREADPLWAPGLKRRGDAFYWVAANCVRDPRDYPVKTVRLHHDTEIDRAARCRALYYELQEWLGTDAKTAPPRYDGTLASLCDLYELHPESSFHGLRYHTQREQVGRVDRIRRVLGKTVLDGVNGLDVRRWHSKWSGGDGTKPGPKLGMGQGMVTTLKQILSFGAEMGFADCRALRQTLSAMRFKQPSRRRTFVTYEQAVAIIDKAHEMGLPSIALAQALQFDLTMRQIDVIGVWEPERPGDRILTASTHGRLGWRDGLEWQMIDRDLVLNKSTTKTGSDVAFNLALYPLVMRELGRIPERPAFGPMIVSEVTRKPYRQKAFGETWTKIARAAGVPEGVWNRDSRAGGATEGSDAGAELEFLRHHLGHENVATTARYSRKTLTKTAEVARLRAAHREKKG